jgi:hypothetical protein
VDGTFRLGQVSRRRLERLQQAIEAERHFPFAAMLSMSGEQWSQRIAMRDPRGKLQYDQAWSMVHFLVHGGERLQRAFVDYLEQVARGTKSTLAFSRAFGTGDPAAFEQAWKRYVLELDPDPLNTAEERVTFLAEGLKLLHERGERVESIEQLKSRLQRLNFDLVFRGHGQSRTMEAANDENFEPPRSRDGDGELRLIESDDPRTPPTLRVTGVGATVQLRWQRGEGGELVAEVVLE